MYEVNITERNPGESFTITLHKDWMGASDFLYAVIEGPPIPCNEGFTYPMRLIAFEEAAILLKENPNAPVIKITT